MAIRRSALEKRILHKIGNGHLHPQEVAFLGRLADTVEEMRQNNVSEEEIRRHLLEARKRHKVVIDEILGK